MLKADQAPYFETCPRCGAGGLEILKSHCFCVNCNYSEWRSDSDSEFILPDWVFETLGLNKKKFVIA